MTDDIKVDIKRIIEIAQQAGQLVIMLYKQASHNISYKLDKSVLTRADIESHTFIYESLKRYYPTIPIISEESEAEHVYEVRHQWDYFFLIDPLDGTKEFIQRNDEFTINIALIKKNKPILGVINAPAVNLLYYAERDKGAYKIINKEHIALPLESTKQRNTLRIAISRSHACAHTSDFIMHLEKAGKTIETISSGSALKFCLVAEGSADIYPRFGNTMEWDTAAGQIIASEAGKKVRLIDNETLLEYNKLKLINPGFIVE